MSDKGAGKPLAGKAAAALQRAQSAAARATAAVERNIGA